MKRIQTELFAADTLWGNSAIAHLRGKLNPQFRSQTVPDAFFFFPIDLGGLDLIILLIPLLAACQKSLEDPSDLKNTTIEQDVLEHERAKKAFLDGSWHSVYSLLPARKENLISVEEFTRHREDTSANLAEAYEDLLDTPMQTKIESTPVVQNARKALQAGLTSKPTSLYDDWAMELYGPEIIRQHGGLAMGEKRLLPIGPAETLQRKKVRWRNDYSRKKNHCCHTVTDMDLI